MPKIFEYTAHAGNTVRRDTMTAENEKQVRAWLREQGMYPLDIKPVRRRSNVASNFAKAFKTVEDPRLKKKTSEAERKKVFLYEAIPFSGGDAVRGDIVAVDERSARQQLRERSLFPVKVSAKPFFYDLLPTSSRIASEVESGGKVKKVAAPSIFDDLSERLLPRAVSMRKVPIKEIVFYTQQLSTMLDAGISIAQTLEILNGSITNRRLLTINNDVQSQIFEGNGLSAAFGEHRQFLPDVFVELLAVGEQSGNMEETTNRLADYLEKTAEMQRKVKSAMTYPAVMLGLISLIVTGLMIFVVPTFMNLFDEFNLDLPITTKILLATSKFIQHDWWAIPLVGFTIYMVVSWFFRTHIGVATWDRIEYKIPLIGKVTNKVMVSRMLYNLALFLKCGVPITTTLESVRENTRNHIVSAKVEEIRLGIVQGARMASLFEASGLFPPFVNHLMVAGEESGSMDDLLLKGAKYVDQEIEAAIKALTAAIEPLMTVFIAGIVIFILGSLYMPLIGLMSNTSKVSG